jgi:UDP-N-acetylmuramoyl-tripeptide--D-alanyl-D-alanine ligase
MIVSIGSCHLEFFLNHAGVAKEKSDIFLTLPENGGKAVIPLDAPEGEFLRKAAEEKAEFIYTFGESEKADMQVKYLSGTLSGSSFELCDRTGEKEEKIQVDWILSGKHQACNAAGAAAMARHFGIPLSVIGEGLANTVLPGMRMRQTRHGEALWLNDAYNANPDSMRSGLLSLGDFADPSKIILVLGDMGELGDEALREHMKVLSFARELFPTTVICCIGRKMEQALALLNPVTPDPAAAAFREPGREALEFILENTGKGSIVYLKGSRSTALEKLEEALEK